MKDMIREYFSQMLENGFDLESAKDNMLDIIIEIASEFKKEEER